MPWWRVAGESRTKQLYPPESKPVVYIVYTISNLGRLPLIPVRDHSTIPAAMKIRKKDLFEYGKCDETGSPDTDSKLYYIILWVMRWQSDHQQGPLLAEVCVEFTLLANLAGLSLQQF